RFISERKGTTEGAPAQAAHPGPPDPINPPNNAPAARPAAATAPSATPTAIACRESSRPVPEGPPGDRDNDDHNGAAPAMSPMAADSNPRPTTLVPIRIAI